MKIYASPWKEITGNAVSGLLKFQGNYIPDILAVVQDMCMYVHT